MTLEQWLNLQKEMSEKAAREAEYECTRVAAEAERGAYDKTLGFLKGDYGDV